MSFKWDKKRIRAAVLVADGKLTEAEIAEQVGVSVPTLARWKADADFEARRSQIVEDARKALEAAGIANRQNRLNAYNDRHQRMRQVIEARAKEHKSYAGGGGHGAARQTVEGHR